MMTKWERLAHELRLKEYTHLIVGPGASFAYLTGMTAHVSERLTLFGMNADGHAALLLPKLEASGVPRSLQIHVYTYSDELGPVEALKAFASDLGVHQDSRVGIESGHMRIFEEHALRQVGITHLVSADEVPMALRLIKDSHEVALLQSAAQIVDAALTSTLPLLKVGMTELEVAAELEYQMRKLGSEGTPFGTIVGSGPRGALPHGGPTTKQIEQGELVVLDYGALIAGYAADTTRTIAFGEPSIEARKVYDVVLLAQETAVDGVVAGITAEDVDELARTVITEAGYGDYFTHRTGHGLGLDVHEYPSIMKGNPLVLTPGMVFTIEPGIYLPERFGVRIEDDIVITEDSAQVLTQFTKDLLIVGD
ncbi:putative peptidase [Acidibacillus sp. S0AB]|uniref:Peptidase n=2 Tax=Sulfoacidibacillus ferrooxidans TaxID=2005001 RepID=A0A9X2ADX7_9BACL|nr:putative peptidase [Sulfoacidibacillus ferrooxidans]